MGLEKGTGFEPPPPSRGYNVIFFSQGSPYLSIRNIINGKKTDAFKLSFGSLVLHKKMIHIQAKSEIDEPGLFLKGTLLSKIDDFSELEKGH